MSSIPVTTVPRDTPNFLPSKIKKNKAKCGKPLLKYLDPFPWHKN
jgi:hypothetical protein